MNLVSEYAAGADFPSEISYSCFFQVKNDFYGLACRQKRLYQSRKQETAIIGLGREYLKIAPDPDGTDFFAYTQFPNKNELYIYCLDSKFKELDCLKIRKPDNNSQAADLWYDKSQGFLFLVYPKFIMKYNSNGDCLGCFLGASLETDYCAMCTFEDLVFLAYRRGGCPYVGMYRINGSFIEKISFGPDYRFCTMQVIDENHCGLLRLYGYKKGDIPIFCEIKFQQSIEIPEVPEISAPCCHPTSDWMEDGQIEVEIVSGHGIGETTCHIQPPCHTSRLAT